MRRTLALSALVLVAGGSIAWAAIPDSEGVIHACFDNASGKLRVFDTADGAPKPCGGNETALDWNHRGPQGTAGPQGPKGDTGDTGPQGPAGLSGVVTVFDQGETSDQDGDVITVRCPVGKRILGGGATVGWPTIGVAPAVIFRSFPQGDAWTGAARRLDLQDERVWNLAVHAICADVAP